MHRKLCWIEVDEEGLACLDLATTERACQRGLGLSVGTYLAEMPDATEEVVKAVAKIQGRNDPHETDCDDAVPCDLCVDRARSLLTRLASAPPPTNGGNDGV